MRRNQSRFTLIELFVFIWLASLIGMATLIYWVIRALMKYVGA